ncbi:RHS repeat domain-containing protein, partial [Alistipes communis]
HKGDPSGDGPQNRYEFTYDDLSRLTHTDQYVNGERVRQNVERHLSYDRNGNLLSVIRYENGEEQCNMKYQYQGNHLYRYMEDELVDVDFGADTVTMLPSVLRFENLKPWLALHEYDANGNVTKDWERGLDMSYNCLNLLEYASDNDANAINYCYLADGTKLSATTGDDCGFSYRGSFTYRTDESSQPDRVFESTPFGGGRIVGTVDDETEVRYFLTDHLGSVRAVVNSGCEVLERNDYQPFGKRWVTPSMPVSDNRDRFNGKEDQSFAGLPFSDYGARMYDYERGRWLMQDPKSEDYFSSTQYGFCGNNPVARIDPNGMAWFQNISTGELYFNELYTAENVGDGYMNGNDSWVYFGPNDMFDHPDEAILSFLTGDFNGTSEGVFDSSTALRAMDWAGYESKPLLADIEVTETTQRISEGEITITLQNKEESVINVYSKQFVKKGSYEIYDLIKRVPKSKGTQFWTASTIDVYTETRQYHYQSEKPKRNFDLLKQLLWEIASTIATNR